MMSEIHEKQGWVCVCESCSKKSRWSFQIMSKNIEFQYKYSHATIQMRSQTRLYPNQQVLAVERWNAPPQFVVYLWFYSSFSFWSRLSFWSPEHSSIWTSVYQKFWIWKVIWNSCIQYFLGLQHNHACREIQSNMIPELSTNFHALKTSPNVKYALIICGSFICLNTWYNKQSALFSHKINNIKHKKTHTHTRTESVYSTIR